MQLPKDINDYPRARAPELAERILRMYPPLCGVDQPASPLSGQLLRKPFSGSNARNNGRGADWARSDRPSNDLVLRDGIFQWSRVGRMSRS